jgi:hypothetical protein
MGRNSSPRRVNNFHFSIAFRQDLGPNQPPIQWVLEALSLIVKRPGREADHSSPTSAKVKKTWVYTQLSHTSSWRSSQLSKGRTFQFLWFPNCPRDCNNNSCSQSCSQLLCHWSYRYHHLQQFVYCCVTRPSFEPRREHHLQQFGCCIAAYVLYSYTSLCIFLPDRSLLFTSLTPHTNRFLHEKGFPRLHIHEVNNRQLGSHK